MDCQKLIVYGILGLVSLYLLKDICGINIPFIEGYENEASPAPIETEVAVETTPEVTMPAVEETVVENEPVVDGALADKGAPVQGIKTTWIFAILKMLYLHLIYYQKVNRLKLKHSMKRTQKERVS